MFVDRILATIAVLGVVGFISIIILWVPRTDLIVVSIVVVILMCYDFYRDLGPGRGRRARTPE